MGNPPRLPETDSCTRGFFSRSDFWEGRHVLYRFPLFFFGDHNKFAPTDYQVVLALMFASRYELYGTGLKVLDTVIRLDPSDRVDARTVRLGVSRIDLREKESFRHALFERDF